MAGNLNKVELMGRLTADPSSKTMPSGQSACSFSLATNYSYKDKASGERKNLVEFHNVVAYGGLAETIAKYAHKGSHLYVAGSLRTRSWDDKTTGQKRYRTEVSITEMQFLDTKSPTYVSSETPGASTSGPVVSPDGYDLDATSGLSNDDDVPSFDMDEF
jgi:single-strand DNA-binding protein